MWNKFKNLFKKVSSRKNNSTENEILFSDNIKKNINYLRKEFEKVSDVQFRQIILSDKSGHEINAWLIYIDSLTKNEIINNNILKPLMLLQREAEFDFSQKDNLGEIISHKIISVEDIKKTKIMEEAIDAILAGRSLLLIDNINYALSIGTQGWQERNVSMPNVERTVRGPQDAFMENIEVNTGLVRRRIKSKDLKVIPFKIGKHSHTKINVMYLEGIADKNIVQEVKKRMESIDVGQVNGCNHVAELTEDNPLSIFGTFYDTERPDVIAAGVNEGRVAILTDGCPTALLVPSLFMENFISPEDYYYRFWYTFAVRTLRFIAYLTSTLLPAIYAAVISFHQELIPMTLVRSIIASREGVPFPILFELLLFLFFFQLIKEAGAVVPTALSTSITIVGTLILGQAAISAGFLSADGVIVGSITGISVFLIPVVEFSNSLLYVRIAFLFAGGTAGFYGITLVAIILVVHLASLRSFGVPYLSPVAPLQFQDLKDFFIRVPYIFMSSRPESLADKDLTQQGNKPVRRFFFKYNLTENNDQERD